jgi:hypothetical protein
MRQTHHLHCVMSTGQAEGQPCGRPCQVRGLQAARSSATARLSSDASAHPCRGRLARKRASRVARAAVLPSAALEVPAQRLHARRDRPLAGMRVKPRRDLPQAEPARVPPPRLGRLPEPRHYRRAGATASAGVPWAADNDVFGGWDQDAERPFLRTVEALSGLPGCLFGRSFGALFIGGASAEFKLGPRSSRSSLKPAPAPLGAHGWRQQPRRLAAAASIACDSIDGTKWVRVRDTYLCHGLTTCAAGPGSCAAPAAEAMGQTEHSGPSATRLRPAGTPRPIRLRVRGGPRRVATGNRGPWPASSSPRHRPSGRVRAG